MSRRTKSPSGCLPNLCLFSDESIIEQYLHLYQKNYITLTFQIIKNKAQTEIKPHYHNHMTEVYHILKGNAIVFCGEIQVRAFPGDTLLCEPREVHGLKNDTDQDFLFVVFKINSKEDDLTWI